MTTPLLPHAFYQCRVSHFGAGGQLIGISWMLSYGSCRASAVNTPHLRLVVSTYKRTHGWLPKLFTGIRKRFPLDQTLTIYHLASLLHVAEGRIESHNLENCSSWKYYTSLDGAARSSTPCWLLSHSGLYMKPMGLVNRLKVTSTTIVCHSD